MRVHIPQPNHYNRFAALAFGLLVLIWMSLEDHRALSVAFLGTGLAILVVCHLSLRRFGGHDLHFGQWFIGSVILGAGSGALSALMTTLLMFFKTSWHGHAFGDYPPLMMWAMLQRMPFWALAGALIGLAIGLIKLSFWQEQRPAEKVLSSE